MKEKLTALVKGIAKPFAKMKKMKKGLKIALCLLLVVAIGLGTTIYIKKEKSKSASAGATQETSVVLQGSVVDSITGSGTVEPIEQREIVPLVKGKITESPFEEGDSVMMDDVLYRFEMTTAQNAIKTAQNNVEKARTTLSNRKSNIDKVKENIANLTIVATQSGKISGLSLKVGEDASGKICTITNFKEQTVILPFSASQINSIKVGNDAEVAVDKYMITVGGKVVRKYSAPETLSSGAVVYNVEILLDDKYIVEENVNVTAVINTSAGKINSASYGSVKYADPVTVNAEQRGKVSKINYKNGDWVDEGEVIAVLKNTDLNDELKNANQSYKDAQMSLSEAESNLEDKEEAAKDYVVTSPIDGVILTKDYTVGDTVSGQNSTTMMVIADMSKMKFTISVDELDISKIQIGQSVTVKADALEGQRLQGRITSVSKLGTASNGVTNYPIEVTIDRPGDLMPGMNVSAEIIVARADNCLYLPVSAVEYFEGKYYVTVVGEAENVPVMPQRTFGGNMGGSDSENKEGADKEGANTTVRPQYGNYGGGQGSQRLQGGEGAQNRPDFSGGNREGFQGKEGYQGNREGFQGNKEGSAQQKPEGMTDGEGAQKAEQKPVEQKGAEEQKNSASKTEQGEKATKDTQKKESSDKNEEKSSEKGNAKGQSMTKREPMKIKLSGKEERVEVQIGISNDSYYEIKSGVTLGQVVKNSSQANASSQTGMNRNMGGMGGMNRNMGGMMGNMGGMNRNMGGSVGNRTNRSSGGMGGR